MGSNIERPKLDKCPTCGRDDFSSAQYIRSHHTKVHGEHLPNCVCKGCGSEFYHPNGLKFCSDCEPFKGENNGNWKGASNVSECRLCGTEIQYYPSDKRGIYCSDCVQSGDAHADTGRRHECCETTEVSCGNCGVIRNIAEDDVEDISNFYCGPSCESVEPENRRTQGQTSNELGTIAETAATLALVKNGYDVSLPIRDSSPYDMVVDDCGELYRVQVKSGILHGGSVEAKLTREWRTSDGYESKTYGPDMIDSYVIYCAELDTVYWIPYDDAPKTTLRLRVDDPQNNQTTSVRFSDEYLI